MLFIFLYYSKIILSFPPLRIRWNCIPKFSVQSTKYEKVLVVVGGGLLRHLSSYSSSTLFPHPPYCFVKLVSLHSLSLSPCWLPSKCNLINECRLLMFDCEIIWQNATCLHCTLLWMYSGDSISKLKFRLNWMSVAYSLIGSATRLKLIQPWTRSLPDVLLKMATGWSLTLILRRSRRERYGSSLLPAKREQHDQNCTQSH